jgi:hypothetical protein
MPGTQLHGSHPTSTYPGFRGCPAAQRSGATSVHLPSIHLVEPMFYRVPTEVVPWRRLRDSHRLLGETHATAWCFLPRSPTLQVDRGDSLRTADSVEEVRPPILEILLIRQPTLHICRVVSKVLADAVCTRTQALRSPLVHRLLGHLKPCAELVRRQEALALVCSCQ